MSEDFVRCTNCGNLNIKGTMKCVFCDAEIDVDAEVIQEHADDPSVSSLPGVPPVTPSDKAPDLPAMPKLPDVEPSIEKKDKKKIKIEEPAIIKEYSSGLKFLYLTLIFLAVSIVHYLLNFLVALTSFEPLDPNLSLSLFNIPADIAANLFIKGSSMILGIPFAIIIGYILGKSIRKFTLDRKRIIYWLIYAIFIDIIANLGIAAVFIFGFNFVDLYFLYLVGAVFIFIIFNILTLFIPFLVGSHLIFCNIEKIFSPKKHSSN
ncbi:MAG: hypothetical protein KGD64_10935 [Candidatus Heimdallarchaeota archaeon]|nr:hypothetical protein [Candidatus Heimdallarchaeota archaeon]